MTDLELLQAAHEGRVEDLPTYGYLIDWEVPDMGTWHRLDRLRSAGLLQRETPGGGRSLLRPVGAGLDQVAS